MERFIRHHGPQSDRMYTVRLYGYSPADDTIEPPHHITCHFIDLYWARQRRTVLCHTTCDITLLLPTVPPFYFSESSWFGVTLITLSSGVRRLRSVRLAKYSFLHSSVWQFLHSIPAVASASAPGLIRTLM